jgi:hypothetical protein
MTTKVCTKCLIEKPLTEFHKDLGKKDGLRNDCRACSCSRARKHHADNPDKAKDFNLRRYYGITLAEYQDILEAQNGRCAICGTDVPGGKGVFHVDHCHNSGKVRGLLCHHCNVGLGHFKDNESILLKAALYLSNHYDDTSSSHQSDA